MEENNKITEVSEKANTQPTREEILAISREENKHGDEREQNYYSKGMRLAYCIGVILIGIISIVNAIVVEKTPVELWMVYMGMTTVTSLYYAIKVGKHRPLFLACGVVCSIACVLFTVIWIMQLCGVM